MNAGERIGVALVAVATVALLIFAILYGAGGEMGSAAFGRIAPDVDDFEQGADGALPETAP